MKELFEKTKALVLEASHFMMEDFTVSHKGVISDVVTSADYNVQAFLYENLTKLIPGSGFYGEENHLIEIEGKEYVWIVDPIDGTTNFSRHFKFSVISVALKHNEDIVMGLVYNPFTSELFHAIKGEGAFLNGKPIHVSDKPFEDSIFCTALCAYKKELSEVANKILFDTYMECNDFRRMGSCAQELCYIACGRCDIYFEIKLNPWDYSASELILAEAGGYLRGLKLEKLTHFGPSPLIGANNLENLKRLSAIVDRHIKDIKDIC